MHTITRSPFWLSLGCVGHSGSTFVVSTNKTLNWNDAFSHMLLKTELKIK